MSETKIMSSTRVKSTRCGHSANASKLCSRTITRVGPGSTMENSTESAAHQSTKTTSAHSTCGASHSATRLR